MRRIEAGDRDLGIADAGLARHRQRHARHARQRPPDLEEAHRRARHVGGDRLVADDQQPRPRREDALEIERLDQRLLDRAIRREARDALEGAPEVRQHVALADAPRRLDPLPRPRGVAERIDHRADGRERLGRETEDQALAGGGRRRRAAAGGSIDRVGARARADAAGQRREAGEHGGAIVDPRLVEQAPRRQQQHRAERPPQRVLAVVLDHRPQRVPLHEEALLSGRLGAAGRAVAVVDDRGVLDAHVEARESQPPAEIDVVVVGEERVVEAAGAIVGGAGHGEGAAVREERVGGAGAVERDRLAVVILEAARLEADRAAQEVDRAAVPAEDAGGGAGRPVSGGGDETAYGVRLDPHVVVEEHEHVAGRGGDAGRVPAGEALVRGERDDADAGVLARDPLDGPVGRAVVDDDDLQPIGGIVAGGDRRQARAEVLHAVPGDDDDRGPWQFWQRGRGLRPGLRPGLGPGLRPGLGRGLADLQQAGQFVERAVEREEGRERAEVVGEIRGAVGAGTQEARQRAFGGAPASAKAELIAGQAGRLRRRAQRLDGAPRELDAEAIRGQAAKGGEDPVPAGEERVDGRIERPGGAAAAGGAGVHLDDGRGRQPGRQILQQADAPPRGIEPAGFVEGRLPDGPRGHRPAIDRRQAARRGRFRQLGDQIGAGRGRRPGHGGDIRARLDRQARAARGGERPQRLDAERGPRLEDDDDVAAGAADRVADHGRGAARRVARFTRLDHLGAGTGVGDARGERVPDRRVRPVRAGEDEGDRHARPTRRRTHFETRNAGERSISRSMPSRRVASAVIASSAALTRTRCTSTSASCRCCRSGSSRA